MIARIKNYKVGLCRGKNEGPIRTMELSVECRDDPGVHRVFVHFFERKPATLGFLNRATDSVICFLPVADFDLTRELLHTQADEVFFAWTNDAEGGLVWAEITTAEEPLHAASHAPAFTFENERVVNAAGG